MSRTTLYLAAAATDVEQAREVAQKLRGALLADEREDVASLPFRALVCAVTDRPEPLLSIADVGAWIVCRRSIKERPAGRTGSGPIALFPMVRHPSLTHEEADAHWRDRHAPLALEHHPAMSHYAQLSVVHRLDGPDWDGFALCGFDALEDLRTRFYGSPQGRRLIREDVAKFADPARSPRRLIVTEESYPLDIPGDDGC